ncbi:hypothetical protein J2Z32_000367 [Paenibacillus turicensis]|uniref:Integron gene cassette protein n=1 Tax=Paenibacillus turicensis TaxID=160487 RepID=A0ABS4FME6_9BACL|nr:hypothetical protein [Paenibacillus turicensis]MBP1903755.1 hypothetical protein [Paenibacillus turicensis]
MQSIVVKLDPVLLANPDLDLRYEIPEAIELYTNGKIVERGYDYLEDENNSMTIWLGCDDANTAYLDVLECFKQQKILENDLTHAVEIYTSIEEDADFDKCKLVYRHA